MPLTLNEKSTLASVLVQDKNIKANFGEEKLYDRLYDMASTITDKQKSYIYYLLNSKSYIKLRNLLIDLKL